LNAASKIYNSSRRQFIKRVCKSVFCAASVCFVGYRFHDSKGLLVSTDQADAVTLPDFSIPEQKNKLCIVKGSNRVKTINLALKSMGGIESFIKKNDRVLIKVNAAFATMPELSATTNPLLLSEVIKLCYKAGAKSVIVIDNPINDPASCFKLTGIAKAAQESGANIIMPRKHLFKKISVKNASLIVNWPVFYTPFEKTDKVINIAPVKNHHRSGASMTMKNWYGLLGGHRNIFHQDIHNLIKELAMMITPTLAILDGTTTMMRNGPTGGSFSDLKSTNTIIAGTDQVAVDAFGATLLGKSLNELVFIEKAQNAGAGKANYKLLDPEIISI